MPRSPQSANEHERAQHTHPPSGRTPAPADRAERGASLSGIDAVIHERMRLAIVSALVASDVLSFTDLKTQLGMTDGNLALHVRRLEEAGYLASQKVLEGRMPHTEYRLTAAGRKALDRYLAHMEALIREIRGKG